MVSAKKKKHLIMWVGTRVCSVLMWPRDRMTLNQMKTAEEKEKEEEED